MLEYYNYIIGLFKFFNLRVSYREFEISLMVYFVLVILFVLFVLIIVISGGFYVCLIGRCID